MNNEIFKLMGTIGVDTKDAKKNVEGFVDDTEKEANKIPGFFKTAALAIGTAFALGKLVDFGKSTVEAAASAMAIKAQFVQVFGDTGTEAQTLLDKMAADFGMLPNRLVGPLTTTTSMFKGLGLSTEDAMGQAKVAVTLAADAAAFYDKSYEDANSALSSFIKGNYEGGESIGLFANETQLATWAADKLGVKFKDLSEADKQMARLQFATAMQEAAGATGQASRESDSYQNKVGNMQQAWTDFKTTVGEPILPIVIDALTTLSGWLQTATDKVKEFTTWAKDNKTTIEIWAVVIGTITALIIAYNIQQALATANTTLWGVVSGIASAATTALGAAFVFLTSPIGLIILAIGALIIIGVLLYKNWDTIKEKAVTIFNAVKDAIMGPIDSAVAWVKKMIDKLLGFFDFKWSLPKLKLPHVKIEGEFSLLPPKIPKFSLDWYKDGGIMTGPTVFGASGQSLLAGGEAGREAVLPLNRETLGGIGDGIVRSTDMSNSRLLAKVDKMIEILREMVAIDPNYQIVLDTGILAGELTPRINSNFGRDADRRKRGG